MMQQTANAGASKAGYTAQPEPFNLLKRIGSTTFEVSVHFSTVSEETLGDKMTRLLEKEALQG